jgi:hypothetical protein
MPKKGGLEEGMIEKRISRWGLLPKVGLFLFCFGWGWLVPFHEGHAGKVNITILHTGSVAAHLFPCPT